MKMNKDTIYVYDKDNGSISYTVENADKSQIEFFKNQNIPHFVDSSSLNIRGVYVIHNEDGAPHGVALKQYFQITLTHDQTNPLIADGIDKVVFSNIPEKTKVSIGRPFSCTYISDSSDPTLEFTANGVHGTNSNITVTFTKYGYHTYEHYIPLWMDIWGGDANAA